MHHVDIYYTISAVVIFYPAALLKYYLCTGGWVLGYIKIFNILLIAHQNIILFIAYLILTRIMTMYHVFRKIYLRQRSGHDIRIEQASLLRIVKYDPLGLSYSYLSFSALDVHEVQFRPSNVS